MSTSSSLTARRSAASNLPNFQLPRSHLTQKYPPLSTISAPQSTPANVRVGNLLTPPSNIPGDSLSPISSGINSGPNTAANQGLPPYTPTGYWPTAAAGSAPFSFGTGTTPQPWGQGPVNPLFPPRNTFSPSFGSVMRNNSNSPTATDGLPAPPYDQMPPFSTSVAGSASLPAIITQQQHAMASAYINSQTPVSNAPTQSSPVNAHESYMHRPPHTPNYYNGAPASSTPQQTQYGAFAAPSPVQQSPLGIPPPNSRISPIDGQHPNLQPAPLQQFSRPMNSGYSLPAMAGPIFANTHSPGGPMSLVGNMPGGIMPGFNSGHVAQMQQMYGGPQQPVQNDRPFKCDQCPQSFNRNHDLKRHKRIHLAVKPFPCGHCEKSFSRKDALKRHILVKGCGKASNSNRKAESMSPVSKTEAVSSENDDSPVLS
ncbi:hypothetical protein MMC20_000506 [Loxospora ochrophaea]|nr:hypothetical protein [Loxospora ochrophaea]